MSLTILSTHSVLLLYEIDIVVENHRFC